MLIRKFLHRFFTPVSFKQAGCFAVLAICYTLRKLLWGFEKVYGFTNTKPMAGNVLFLPGIL